MTHQRDEGVAAMLGFKTYTCVKCGKQFSKRVGGVVMSPSEMELALHPVCDQCKMKTVSGALSSLLGKNRI